MMAKESRASEANHWYTRDGLPMYTIEAAKGGHRATTLRDARKLNLVPSVTTVINVAAKPGLIQWMQKQILLAALTLPKIDNETEENFIARIIDDSKEQGRSAADAGTDIHAAIQGFYEGQVINRHQEHVSGCIRALEECFEKQGWISERSFAHDLGFGGKCDLHVPATEDHQGLVADIKTKEFSESDKIESYDEHLMQLSAYRVGLGLPDARCVNVFVSRSAPGLTRIVEHSQDDLARGWKMFYALLNFWQLKYQHS